MNLTDYHIVPTSPAAQKAAERSYTPLALSLTSFAFLTPLADLPKPYIPAPFWPHFALGNPCWFLFAEDPTSLIHPLSPIASLPSLTALHKASLKHILTHYRAEYNSLPTSARLLLAASLI